MRNHFDVDVSALISLLSDHLYTDKRVAIRELIQNSRDSLLQLGRSCTLTGESPCVTVQVRPTRRQLCIGDNGVGMSLEQVGDSLAVIARSGTRLLRSQLATEAPELAGMLAGEFGLGLLSGLIIAESVEVRTRSRAQSGPAVYWACHRGSSEYTMRACDWDHYGTEVTLTLTPDFVDLTSPGMVGGLVRRYCDLVEFPIYVEGSENPVNRMIGPWRDSECTQMDVLRFLRETGRLDEDEELVFVDLLRKPEGYGGIVFLPRGTDREGRVDLHVRHLFVNSTKQFLPESLDFFHAVIDAPDLPLTLSREAIVGGEALEKFRDDLRTAVLHSLCETRQRLPQTFRRVVDVFGRHLKFAAVRDDEVLRQLGPDLDIRLTTGQSMSLDEVLRRGNDRITFIDDAQTQQVYGALYAAKGVPVVDCTDRLDHALVHKFCSAQRKDFARADVSVEGIIRYAEGGDWRLLEHLIAFCDDSIDPKAVELESDVPALFLKGEPDVLRDLLAEVEKGHRGGESREAIRQLMDVVGSREELRRRTLFVNIRHSLSKVLVEAINQKMDSAVLRAAGRCLIAAAKAHSAPLNPAERKDVFVTGMACLEELLKRIMAAANSEKGEQSTGP